MSIETQPFSKYKLLSVLAVGGMGTVYLARIASGPGAGRIVVLKCVSPAHSSNRDYRHLFESEIKVMLGFSHPNIVTLLDTGEESGSLYITLDWIEGRNLKQLQVASDMGSVPIEPTLALHIGIEAAHGLHYAHTFLDRTTNQIFAVIHRDISPSNILVSYDGTVKVIDFGIAKTLTDEQNADPTQTMGKVGYMAPEQFTGGKIGPKTDLFSLATVIWGLLTGKVLFQGENDGARIWKITSNDYPILPPSRFAPNIPASVDAVLLRALSRDPERRPASMFEFSQDLEKALRKINPGFSRDKLGQFMKEKFEKEILADRAEFQQLVSGTGVPKVAVAIEPDKSLHIQTEFDETKRAGMATKVASRGGKAEGTLPPPVNQPGFVPLPNLLLRPEISGPASASAAKKETGPQKKITGPVAASERKDVLPYNELLNGSLGNLPKRSFRNLFTSKVKSWLFAAAFAGAAFAGVMHKRPTEMGVASPSKKVGFQLTVSPYTRAFVVSLDGQKLPAGVSDFQIPYDTSVKLVVEHDRYLPYTRTLFVPSTSQSSLEKLNIFLSPVSMGTISVTADLSADVSITSGILSWQEKTPLRELIVPEGTYQIVVKNAWLQYERSYQVSVKKGQALHLKENIQKPAVRLPANQRPRQAPSRAVAPKKSLPQKALKSKTKKTRRKSDY